MGSPFTIVPHQCCDLSSAELEFSRETASRLLHQTPGLRINSLFQELVPKSIVDAPSLHVDDLTEIQNATEIDIVSNQERARLRATGGDVVAIAMAEIEGYESYCRDWLGLGAVDWIHPACHSHNLRLAEACWEDREVRRDLVHRIRTDGMRYIHPYMGSRAPWELALLLSQASHLPVEVIAPPPAVTDFANDKGAFAALVNSMFGEEATPTSSVVWNTATTAKQLHQLASSPTRMVAIKLPSSASGAGNLLIPMTDIRNHSLREIDAILHQRLPALKYKIGDELLVTQWLDDIVASPSAQLWIPPKTQGLPIMEGLFLQVIEEQQGCFCGFQAANLPRRLEEQLTRQCLQLARVYQLLGYVGRCSFDMLLIGSDIEASKMEFIECNGRWGGTSLPMTLMNQIFGDWQKQPFSVRTITLQDGNRLSFSDLLRALSDALFRYQNNTGRFVLFNPQRTVLHSDFSIIALRDSPQTTDATFDNGLFELCTERIHAAISSSATVR